MPDLIDRTLGGYRIAERIGLGGMATVFKAYQPSMDRYVALKVLSTHLTQDSTFVKRFEQEARVVARLQHARILPVYDHGQEDGYLYLAMRLVEAGTLKDRLEQGPLPLDEARHIVSQVGSALDYAHRQGVIHRDLKPSNVLIDSQGDCYLTDFGIAKLVESTLGLTGSGTVGTPHYMSPEQGQGLAVDHRADVYALGVVIYHMLTGQLPFDADTPIAVMLKHITEPPPLPRSVRPGLPEGVERVMLKALTKDPAHRYQSMGELVAAFDQAVKAAPPPASTQQRQVPPGPLPKLAQVAVQRRWLLAVVGLVLLLLVAGAIGVWSRAGNQKPSPTPTTAAAPAVAAEATQTALPPTDTSTLTLTPLPATQTPTNTPTATGTPTPVPPTSTPTLPPDTPTSTPVPPTPTFTPLPSPPTFTPAPPPLTNTPAPALQAELLRTLDVNSELGDAQRNQPGRGVRGVAFSPDGNILAAGAMDGSVRVWRTSDGEPLITLYGASGHQFTDVAFAPDGAVLASGVQGHSSYSKVMLWQVSDWDQFRILEDFPTKQEVLDIAFTPDGATIAGTARDCILRVWQVAQGPITPVQTLTGCYVEFSPDGGLLAVGIESGEVQLWRVSDWTPQQALIGHTGGVRGLAFSPDGATLASGAADNTARLWQVADGTLLRTLGGHTGSVNGLAFSPDGTILASGSSNGGVRLWQVADGTHLSTLEGHLGDVWSVAFNPDGTLLASASQDGTVRVWRVGR